MDRRKKYNGVVIPAVTPLTADHTLDHEGVKKMFSNFRNHGVSPFILGTTGEAASLAFSLKKEFIQLAGRDKGAGDVLYVGISSNVFVESVALARHAADHGADVLVATLPSYYALTEDAMRRYLEDLADAVTIPLMIYNIPATTHMSIPLHVIDTLSHHERIVGVKDSERSEERLSESLQLWAGREDFSHFLGWAAKSATAILSGGDGLVPSTGNFHPRLYSELYEAAKQGDELKAMKLQTQSDRLGNVYQQGKTLGESLWALKVIMKGLGLCGVDVMPPLYGNSEKEEQEIINTFREVLGNEQIEL